MAEDTDDGFSLVSYAESSSWFDVKSEVGTLNEDDFGDESSDIEPRVLHSHALRSYSREDLLCSGPQSLDYVPVMRFEDDEPSQWLGEQTVKQKRAARFTSSKNFCGKTRRRICPCSACFAYYQSSLKRTDSTSGSVRSLLGSNSCRDKYAGCPVYTVSSIDSIDSKLCSINKAKRWETVSSVLAAHADIIQIEKHPQGAKTITCDVAVEGVLIDETKDINNNNRRTQRHALNWSKQTRYYWLGANRVYGLEAGDAGIVVSSVRTAYIPKDYPLDDLREEVPIVKVSFVSRQTRPANGYVGHDVQVRKSSITDELATLIQSRPNYSYCLEMSSTLNHDRVWASTTPPSSDYKDWFMDVDLGERHNGGRHVRAVVIQGRPPVIQAFPSSAHFASEKDWIKYTGPIYPIIKPGTETAFQFVKKFEVLARAHKGVWFSLGIFKGNDNVFDPVRVELPMIAETKVCFLRIRPLSQNEDGFQGHAPAFRLSVITAIQNNLGARRLNSNAANPPRNVPRGFVRFELVVPPTLAENDPEEKSHRPRRSPFTTDRRIGMFDYYKSSRWYRDVKTTPLRDVMGAELSMLRRGEQIDFDAAD